MAWHLSENLAGRVVACGGRACRPLARWHSVRWLVMVWLLATPAVASTRQENTLLPRVCTDPAVLLEQMALPIGGDEVAQYVATDNTAGFYENFSHSYGRGSGYISRAHTVLRDYAAFSDGQLVDRRVPAAVEQIMPYGHRSHQQGIRQTLLLHSGRAGLSIRLQSDNDALLAIAPLLPRHADTTLTPRDGVVLFADAGQFLAMTADKPFTLLAQGTELDQSRIIADGIQADAVVLRALAPTQQFTLHLAVADSATNAVELLGELRKQDSWQQTEQRLCQRLQTATLITPDADFNRALLWASHSAQSFVVEEFGTGIWAGLPWFRDNWGRDTFIALPGTLLVTGQFDTAKAVLDNFARWQKRDAPLDPEYGRIPNRVAADAGIIYNTVDGTPWMIREALEYLRYSGDVDYVQPLLPLIRAYIDGVERHWQDRDGLLTHDDADTWMDARIANQQAWSPRGNRAVEVQALWFTALDTAAMLATRAGRNAEAERYRQQAARVQAALLAKFWDGQRMADRLLATNQADFSLRPNQLMLVSIPFSNMVPEPVQAALTRNAVQGLLFPHGIASLAPTHRDFHPRHENPVFHHKDAAYHNGTVWGWNAGFTVTALTKFGQQQLAWQLSRNLAEQILFHGTRGSMSELVDALPDEHGQIKLSGTYAQAWSVAEFVRNAYQDYLGFRPNLLANELQFVPALPLAWTSVSAQLPFGRGERLQLEVEQKNGVHRWQFTALQVMPHTVVMDLLDAEGNRQRLRFLLTGKQQHLLWDGHRAALDGARLATTRVMPSQRHVLGELHFLPPQRYRQQDYSVLQGKDVLQQRILQTGRLPKPMKSEEEP